MRASYWTAFGAMALPLGVSLIALATVFSNWGDSLIIVGLVSITIGFVSFVAGWVYTIKDERKATKREDDERIKQEKDELRNQQEHDEIIAILAGSLLKKKMTSPRILRFIEKLREIEGKNEL